MRDFLDFTLTPERIGPNKMRYLLCHNKRSGIELEFQHVSGALSPDQVCGFFKHMLAAYAKRYRERTRQSLTKKQQVFYDKVVEFHHMEGRAPTYDEMCIIMGYSSKGTPCHYVNKLADLGWLWIDDEGMVIPLDIATPEMETDDGN